MSHFLSFSIAIPICIQRSISVFLYTKGDPDVWTTTCTRECVNGPTARGVASAHRI